MEAFSFPLDPGLAPHSLESCSQVSKGLCDWEDPNRNRVGRWFKIKLCAKCWQEKMDWCFHGKQRVFFWLLLSFNFFIGVQLLYNFVLVSAVQQCRSAYIYKSPSLLSLPLIPPSRSSKSTHLSSLCYIQQGSRESWPHFLIHSVKTFSLGSNGQVAAAFHELFFSKHDLRTPSIRNTWGRWWKMQT